MKLFPRCSFVAALAFGLSLAGPVRAADANAAGTNAVRAEEAPSSQEVLRAYLQLQEQLHATQLALEQNQKDAQDTAAKGNQTLNNRLDLLEHALAAQRTQELETMQSSNRVMVIVAGSFAVIGFLAMLLMAYFQWRTVAGLAQLTTALPVRGALGPGRALAALGPGEESSGAADPAAQSNVRLLGALAQLEKRLYQLEQATASPTRQLTEPEHEHSAATQTNGNGNADHSHSDNATGAGTGSADEAERAMLLLRRGETLLARDEAQAALNCFEELLALEPSHAEALVKKGSALERLNKLDQALQCYDQAIATDASMTIAYLHKGGLCNRLERFEEALECYEKALRSQEKRTA